MAQVEHIGRPREHQILFLPPATPEMNPIEQIWKEIRKRGFCNEVFQTIEKVMDRRCDTICSLSPQTVKSITARDWILQMFYIGSSMRKINANKYRVNSDLAQIFSYIKGRLNEKLDLLVMLFNTKKQ